MILLELHCLNVNNAAGNIVVCDFCCFRSVAINLYINYSFFYIYTQ